MAYEFNATFYECRTAYEIYFETTMPGPMTYETAIFDVAKHMRDTENPGTVHAFVAPIYFENAKVIGQLTAEVEPLNIIIRQP